MASRACQTGCSAVNQPTMSIVPPGLGPRCDAPLQQERRRERGVLREKANRYSAVTGPFLTRKRFDFAAVSERRLAPVGLDREPPSPR